MIDVGVYGWRGNPERLPALLHRHSGNIKAAYYGEMQPHRKHDIILCFGATIRNWYYLMTCEGVKVMRFCGSDWYRVRHRQPVLRALLSASPQIHCMYSSHRIKKSVHKNGMVLVYPVDEEHFKLDPSVTRDKAVCYYALGLKPVYRPELIPDDATVIDGSVPYEDMPRLYQSHWVHVRNTLWDSAPKSIYEAYLCGCYVEYNGEEIDSVPYPMLSSFQIPLWVRYLEALYEGDF